jgi:LmbE family N-acetylglucosaminyl deacetylase
MSAMVRSGSDVSKLGTIMGVWAHPDDEAYLSGGLMALARDAGSRVVCMTATRGELGTPDPREWPPDRLAAERTEELEQCLKLLDVREHEWLGYRDGECATVNAAEPVARLREAIERIRPDTVVTFGPDGITGHSDHQAISAWTTAAVELAEPTGTRLLYATFSGQRVQRWKDLTDAFGVFPPGYPLSVPDDQLVVDLTLDEGTADRKVRALMAQVTQTAGLIDGMGLEQYTAWMSEESFVESPVTRTGQRR